MNHEPKNAASRATGAFLERRFEHRFDVNGRRIVALIVECDGRLFVERLGQVVRRPRAYGEVQRRLWPRARPNVVACAALAHLGAGNRGLIAPEKADAIISARPNR